MSVRLRYAPSPTGYLHLGGLRTALYDYLYAKGHGGKYILRIEDTDQTRFVDDAIENLVESLTWAGVVHDEGVFIEDGKLVQKGDYGPYIQSQRLDIYKKYIQILLDKGYAYYCFCSKERLDEVREKLSAEGKTPMYDKHCQNLSKEEVERRLANGEEHVIRLKVPENQDITWTDPVKGTITINSSEVDDQVLIKSDGFPTYHMAVVVDDHLMGITHAVRGEEWLTSTPKQKLLYDYLGLEMPQYIHLPVVVGKDRKKLSKRQGDVATTAFRDKGYLPEALCNYLALVGWSPKDNKELLTMDELIRDFDFDGVSKTAGMFDLDKLNYVNNHYIKQADAKRIAELAVPSIIKSGLMTEEETKERFDWIVLVTDALKERLNYVSEIVDHMNIFFGDVVTFETTEAEEIVRAEPVKGLLEAFIAELESIDEIDEAFTANIFNVLKEKTGAKGKNLFMPVRCAVTGQQHGPDMGKILIALGKEKTVNRLKELITRL